MSRIGKILTGIYEKLEVRGRVEAVVRARDEDLS